MCTRYRGTLLIEDSPISKGLIQALKNKNVNVVTVTPDKEKRSRVIAQSDLFEGGSIFIQEHAEWREIFIRELLDFPGGRHDDQVDALVQGLAYQRGQMAQGTQGSSDDGLLAYSSLLRSFKKIPELIGSCSKCSSCLAVSASRNLTVARTGTYRRVNRRPPASLTTAPDA